MKWTNLKVKNLPIIALEVERVVDIFHNLQEKVKKQNKKEDARQLFKLAEEIQRRVDALDYFYQRQYMDENIAIFHMLSLKLQRLLASNNKTRMGEPNQNQTEYLSMINEHEEGNQSLYLQNQIMMLEQPLFAYYDQQKVKPQPKPPIVKHSPKIQPENSKEKSKSKTNLKKQPLASQTKIKEEKQEMQNSASEYFTFDANSIVTSKVSVDQKLNGLKSGPVKTEKEEIKAKEQVRNSYRPKGNQVKKVAGTKKKTDQWIGNSSSKKPIPPVQETKIQPENTNELKFTIKMSRQQYQSLLEMKNKLRSQGKL